jgi:hypothetical protein
MKSVIFFWKDILNFYIIIGTNTPWLATFVIPAKACIQKCKVLCGFWIPD